MPIIQQFVAEHNAVIAGPTLGMNPVGMGNPHTVQAVQ